MKPRQIEKREFEYERHGRQALIATFDVVHGKVFGTVGDTRTEVDFKNHPEQLIATDPDGEWVIILDQLNTHKLESAVRLVARYRVFGHVAKSVPAPRRRLGWLPTQLRFAGSPSSARHRPTRAA